MGFGGSDSKNVRHYASKELFSTFRPFIYIILWQFVLTGGRSRR